MHLHLRLLSWLYLCFITAGQFFSVAILLHILPSTKSVRLTSQQSLSLSSVSTIQRDYSQDMSQMFTWTVASYGDCDPKSILLF